MWSQGNSFLLRLCNKKIYSFLATISAFFFTSLSLLTYNTAYSLRAPRQDNPCVGFNVGDFAPNPLDCKLFYWCGENHEAISASCPPNMLFNPVTRLCDMATNVQCQQTIQPPTTVSSASEVTVNEYCANAYNQQPNSDSLIFLAHPSNCQQYYMCYYGKALLQQCSSYLHWNSRIGKCDLPLNAKCKPDDGSVALPIAPTTTPGSSATIGDDGIVCPSYGQHIFPHMLRCDLFIYCVKGYVILQRCPFYHYFDVESSSCKTLKKALCIKDLKLEFRKNTF